MKWVHIFSECICWWCCCPCCCCYVAMLLAALQTSNIERRQQHASGGTETLNLWRPNNEVVKSKTLTHRHTGVDCRVAREPRGPRTCSTRSGMTEISEIYYWYPLEFIEQRTKQATLTFPHLKGVSLLAWRWRSKPSTYFSAAAAEIDGRGAEWNQWIWFWPDLMRVINRFAW